MTCCIIAMLIIAHVMAVLRRWGVFWGVIRPADGEACDTVYTRIRVWFSRPRVRMAVMSLVALEMVAAGTWLYSAHGMHIRQLGDQAIGALKGQTIVYAEVCGRDGTDRMVRVVIDESGSRVSETAI